MISGGGGVCLWIQLGHNFHQTSVAVLHFGSRFACGPSLQILVVRPWLILFIHGNDSNTSNFSTVCLRCLSVMQSNWCLNSSAVPNTGTSLFGRIAYLWVLQACNPKMHVQLCIHAVLRWLLLALIILITLVAHRHSFSRTPVIRILSTLLQYYSAEYEYAIRSE